MKSDTTTNLNLEYILEKIVDEAEAIRQKALDPNVSFEPILSILNRPFLYPNSMTLIRGGLGEHKSRLAHTAAYMLLEQGKDVVLIDTEHRLKIDLPRLKRNMRELTNNYNKLNIYSMMLITPRTLRLPCLLALIEKNKDILKGATIIIDNVFDVIGSYSEIPDLCFQLSELKEKYGFSIIATAHHTSRGKNQYLFDSLANVVVEPKNQGGDVVEITFHKVRWSAPVPKLAMQYCNKTTFLTEASLL